MLMADPILEQLVGPANEVQVQIEDNICQALLDTGSQVSTISEQYYQDYLSQTVEICPLTEVLEVENAGGNELPYKGYISTNITIPSVDETHTVLMLVVPSTQYHQETPVLLGTNIIGLFMDKFRELGSQAIPSAWMTASRSLKVYEQHLRRNKVLGTV